MTFAEQTKNEVMEIISEIVRDKDQFVNHPSIDFSRTRKLDLATMIHMILSMGAGSLRSELLDYFSYDRDTVTNSAFLQQRNKLSQKIFPYIMKKFNEKHKYLLFRKKYQLLAADGSSFTFTRNPKDPDTYYDKNNKSPNGYNQIHVIPLFDLLSKRYVDCVIQPIRKKNEFLALAQMMDAHQTVSDEIPIYIADRGFHSLNVFAHAKENGAYFVIRATDVKMKNLVGKDLPKDKDIFDIQIHRILTRTHAKRKRLHPELGDEYKFVCQKVTFDYINEQCPEYPITLRVLRFPISENSYENIITNLPNEEFSMEGIKYLYHLRWGVETSFRTLKYDLGTTHFHSKKRSYIQMEIFAKLTLYNFCSIIAGHAVISEGSKKHTYQVNFSVASKACHYFLALHGNESPPDIDSLIRKNILPIRPNRNYARQRRFRPPVSFNYRFV